MCDASIGQVPEYLKRQKEPNQLAALLQMLQCLLNNKHFAFLEIYVRVVKECERYVWMSTSVGWGGVGWWYTCRRSRMNENVR